MSFIFDEGEVQTKYNEIPIKVKSKVQTGPKIQLGGLKLGLLIPLYQEPSEAVHIVPMAPIRLHAIIRIISKPHLIAMIRKSKQSIKIYPNLITLLNLPYLNS